jgi:transposase-like protein
MRRRKQYSAAFKAKVALEAIRGERSLNEVAAQYQVHPTQVHAWKKKALAGLEASLSDGRAHPRQDPEQVTAQLYEEIGRLKVELDFLKKKSGLHG